MFYSYSAFIQGLYRGSENNEMRLGVCSRSNDVVEPMIKPQWYVRCNDLANEALNAVMDEENKRIEIIPKQYSAEWKRCGYLILLDELLFLLFIMMRNHNLFSPSNSLRFKV